MLSYASVLMDPVDHSTASVASARPVRAARITLAVTFVVFIAAMAYGISVHEQWLDEAHSWLLARDASMIELLTTYLRYEGHPPLWYLIINILTTLGLPYVSLNIAAAVIAAIGALLLYRLEGVPVIVKVLLPFTYFLFYQYGIVARSYVLLFPLLLAVLHIYPRRSERIWTFTLLLILLGNVSVHGLMIAGALTLLYMIDVWRGRQVVAPADVRKQLAALALLVLNCVALIAILSPPKDLAIAGILNYEFSAKRMLLIVQRALFANLFNDPVLAPTCLAIILLWLLRRGVLLEFMVVLAIMTPLTTVYYNVWHEGLFVLVLFFGVLFGYARPTRPPDPEDVFQRRLSWVMTAAFSGVLLVQVFWTFSALRYDGNEAYSGSREAAEFIDRYDLHKKQLYGAGFSVIGVQPYFEKNIFANYHPKGNYSFLDWTTGSSLYITHKPYMREWMDERLREAPEFFLISQKFSSDFIYTRTIAADPRYRRVAVFRGQLFWKTRLHEREHFVLYGRVDALKALAGQASAYRVARTSE